MPRFYIPPARWNPDRLVLDAEESHHAAHVLCLQTGDRVTLFNGEGVQAVAEITGGGKRALELRALEITQSPQPRCRITLGQAVPKGKTFDFIVQKATELGASAVVPLLTERTIVQCDEKKREKWQAVAVEACKQCGQNWLPTVAAPQSLKELLSAPFDLRLIASLQPDARHPKTVLAESLISPRSQSPTGNALGRESLTRIGEGESETRKTLAFPVRDWERGGKLEHHSNVLVLVGPEGDFTGEEIALAKVHGCQPITLGPIVLRAETAALYCLSVLQYENLSL